MKVPAWLRKTKTTAVRMAGPIGLNWLAHQLTKNRPCIFMYHRFGRDDTKSRLGGQTFRRQIRMIKRVRRILTLRELAERLAIDPAGGAGLAVITVDDGYRDFYEHAWPVLREEEVSATFFPVTGFLDGEVWLWPDLVDHALGRTPLNEVSGEKLGLPVTGCWSLQNDRGRGAVWRAVTDYAIDLRDESKWAYLKRLYRSMDLPWPDAIPRCYAPVTWEQLRTMAASGVEIGAHTRTHCRLTRVDADQLYDELAGAKARLEEQLDQPVVSLCYPNGSLSDYDDAVIAVAKDIGYRCGVTAYFDGRQGGLFDLRRHGVGSEMYHFNKCLMGVRGLGAGVRWSL